MNSKTRSKIKKRAKRRKIRVAYERRFANLSRAYLAAHGMRFTSLVVAGKLERYVAEGEAEIGMDVVSTGRTARLNGLKVAAKIFPAFPAEWWFTRTLSKSAKT